MPSSFIRPDEFVQIAQPLIERRDVRGLASAISSNWSLPQIVGLLDSHHTDARKVAALSLSLIGSQACLESLARQLRAEDACLAQVAEHAMWSIWFRCGNDKANSLIARGLQAFARRDVDLAIELFTKAIHADPTFAEAYNQRAMAHYMKENFEASLADCRKTVELMPLHFGAWSGMGHSLACLGDPRGAIDAYRKAKQINPHLECLDELIQEISQTLRS